MAIRVIDDTKLQNIAVAIQSKDNGGQMTVDEMAGRIEAIPTGSDFDMTVTANQVKMIIEVFDFDLSFWTRFGINGGGTVTVDWGDSTTDTYDTYDTYTGNSIKNFYADLEYAPQRKHNYQKAGKYLVILTVANGTMIIGSINGNSTLSEGELSIYYNNNDALRRMYNYKIKELAFGANVVVEGLLRIPFVIIHNKITFSMTGTTTNFVEIADGVTTIGEYWFYEVNAYSIKIPSSVTTIANFAFQWCRVRIIDFTDIQLNENNIFDFGYALNMVYSDYKGNIPDNDKSYVDVAKAFLFDKDGPKGKAVKYYMAMKYGVTD